MTIGKNIKRIRLQRGLTQKELGHLIGIADTMVRRYELGIVNPKLSKLESLAYALNVNIEVLLNSELTNDTAMHRLFQIFNQYDGYFNDSGELCFRNLDISPWRERWIKYQNDIKHANSISKNEVRCYAIEDSEYKFNWWMDTYSDSVCDSKSL